MNYWLLLVPLVSMLAGLLIVKLFIVLLFRPFLPINVLGITIQGILIKQTSEIAAGVGKMAASMLASSGLEQKIGDPKNVEKIKPLIETHVDHFLRVKLKEQMPMVGMFVGDKTINTMKGIFMQEIESLFPQVMQQLAGNLQSELKVEQMVVSKINGISPAELESAFYQHAGNDLWKAGLFGALIGFLTGIIQLVIIGIIT
jgi:uncharacterized membrane protein YheB (UPF0754 family)